MKTEFGAITIGKSGYRKRSESAIGRFFLFVFLRESETGVTVGARAFKQFQSILVLAEGG